MSREHSKPAVLVTNDDGIYAPGLLALVEELARTCDCQVFVCAPDRERSAQSNARTITEPVSVAPATIEGAIAAVQVSGTPADCTALALHAWAAIFPLFAATRPVLVVSGINRGRNCGLDVMYSGTVAGAREAAMMGVPAISSSLCDYRAKTLDDYTTAAALIAPLVRAALNPLAQHRIPRGCVLNVNVPALPRALLKGYFITHQGNSSVVPKVEAVLSPPHSITSAVTRAVQLATSSGTLPLFAYGLCSAAAHTLELAQKLPRAQLSKAALTTLAAAAAVAVLARTALALLPPPPPQRFWFKIGAIAEDATPGADSHEAETGGWVSVTPLGTVTAGDGNAVKVSVSFTSNLLPISASLRDAARPGREAAAFVREAGAMEGLTVKQCKEFRHKL